MTAYSCTALALAACAAGPPPAGQALKARAVLQAHLDRAWSVAFSPDGKTLASGGSSRDPKGGFPREEIKLWDVAGGRARATLKERPIGVTSLAFSPDGKALASAASGAVAVWDVPAGRRREALEMRTGSTTQCVAFSADGERLAAVSDRLVKLWGWPAGEDPFSFRLPVRARWAAFSPDLRLLASPNHQDLDLWEVHSGKLRRALLDHRGAVVGAAFTRDGKTVAAASHRTTDDLEHLTEVKLWDVATGRARATFRRDLPYVHALAFSPDGKLLALAGSQGIRGDGRLRLLDAATGEALAAVDFGKKVRWLQGVAFSPDGRLLAAACDDGAIRLWDVLPPKDGKKTAPQ